MDAIANPLEGEAEFATRYKSDRNERAHCINKRDTVEIDGRNNKARKGRKYKGIEENSEVSLVQGGRTRAGRERELRTTRRTHPATGTNTAGQISVPSVRKEKWPKCATAEYGATRAATGHLREKGKDPAGNGRRKNPHRENRKGTTAHRQGFKIEDFSETKPSHHLINKLTLCRYPLVDKMCARGTYRRR